MPKLRSSSLGWVGLALAFVSSGARAEETWHSAHSPTAGPPRSIGGYSAGCVQGAVELPESGPGYRIGRPENRRVFGHPLLVAFVKDLARELERRKVGLLWIGDLGQARGGPAPSGHASHQTGLDADLWFARAPGKSAEPLPLADLRKGALTRDFGPAAVQMISAAAAAPEVDRIFVNPIIKRALCQSARGDRSWLRKVRPWFGHHEHFHVRLACPADSPDCEAQPPLPEGDGCAELAWWLDPATASDRDKRREQYGRAVGASPRLPKKCDAVRASPDAAGAQD